MITKIKVTDNYDKRHSCSAPVPDSWESRKGSIVEVRLPPLSAQEAIGVVNERCQSQWYWYVVTDDFENVWLCEHAIEID